MAFRTVIIKNRAKLEYSLNYLIVRGDEERKILIDEIEFLIIQNMQCSMTSALLANLIQSKVKVILCDNKANPVGELIPYYNNYSNYGKIKLQIEWSKERKDELWKKIIQNKIYQEYLLLSKIGSPQAEKLLEYYEQVELGDITNREGHAAKVYFNSLFGNKFSRGADNDINKYLNYGYSIIVSCINRELKMAGYLTELGIHHIGETNPFNLTYDFVEPFRTLIDSMVINKQINDENYKKVFIDLLGKKVKYNDNIMFLENAIHNYVQNNLIFLASGLDKVKFVEYEL